MNAMSQAAPLIPGLDTNPAAAKPQAGKHMQEAAQEFEAVFLSQMLSAMFAGVNTSGMFGGGSGEDTYRTFLYQELGKAISRSGGVGISDGVLREMLKHQEVATQ